METYDFNKFIEQIKDMNWADMIFYCNERCLSLEQSSYKIKGAIQRRELGSSQLAEDIKGVLFWLQYGTRPSGLDENKFNILRPVCLKLIEKNQLKPEAIKIFN